MADSSAAWEWDRLYRHASGGAECAFTATRATLRFSSLRCSVPCGVGEIVRYRVRYVAGERLAVGCIVAGPNAADSYSGDGIPGMRSMDDVSGATWARSGGASVRCDGVAFRSPHFAMASHSSGDSTSSGLAENVQVTFAPGDQVAVQLDRLHHTMHVGTEVGGAFRGALVSVLPTAPAALHFVVVQRDGDAVVDLLRPTVGAVPLAKAHNQVPPPLLAASAVFGPRSSESLEVLAQRAEAVLAAGHA